MAPAPKKLSSLWYKGLALLTLNADVAKGLAPSIASSVDEVLSFIILLPLCFSNLSAPMKQTISCSDACETRGAAAEAKRFIPELDQEAASKFEELKLVLEEECLLGGGTVAIACAVCVIWSVAPPSGTTAVAVSGYCARRSAA